MDNHPPGQNIAPQQEPPQAQDVDQPADEGLAHTNQIVLWITNMATHVYVAINATMAAVMHVLLWIANSVSKLFTHPTPGQNLPLPPEQIALRVLFFIIWASCFFIAFECLCWSEGAVGKLQIHLHDLGLHLSEAQVRAGTMVFVFVGMAVISLFAAVELPRVKAGAKFLITSALAAVSFYLGDISAGDWWFEGFIWFSCASYLSLMAFWRTADDFGFIDCLVAINMGFSYIKKLHQSWRPWFFGVPTGAKAILEYLIDRYYH